MSIGREKKHKIQVYKKSIGENSIRTELLSKFSMHGTVRDQQILKLSVKNESVDSKDEDSHIVGEFLTLGHTNEDLLVNSAGKISVKNCEPQA